MKHVFFGVILLACLFLGAAYLHVEHYLDTPTLTAKQRVTVRSGQSLQAVIDGLAQERVITQPTLLYYAARYLELTKIRAGQYEFGPADTPRAILEEINRGQVVTTRLTVVEGKNRWQIRDQLLAEGWAAPGEFDALCDDANFLAQHKISGPNCEGYLFPDTYRFARGVPLKTIMATMFRAYRKVYGAIAAAGSKGPIKLNEREFVTLASIVEKETGRPSERPRIACVFYNRLIAKPRWRLETDPTVIYAARLLDPGFDGNIKRYHLRKMNHPYNTYRVFGLPPGPIANPGKAALQAVANPASCRDFFFVSKNNGAHVFCPTLKCHRAAVKKWQIDYFRHRRRSR